LSTSGDRFLARYRDAVGWARSESLDLSPTRFHDYETILERFRDEGGVSTSWSEADQYLFHDAAVAAMELDRIRGAFGETPLTSEVRRRLKKYLRGGTTERGEQPGMDGSTEPRDTGFELVLGAIFKEAGVDPLFPPVGDLACVVDGCDVNLECKRPQNEGAVPRAVRRAAEQLAPRASNSKRLPVNVIAISAGKILRRGEIKMTAPSVDDARAGGLETLEKVTDRLAPIWQPDKLPGVHAVLLQLETPVHVVPSDDFFAAILHILNPIEAEVGSPEFYAVGRLYERLRQVRPEPRY
jgi:hypothetical protein